MDLLLELMLFKLVLELPPLKIRDAHVSKVTPYADPGPERDGQLCQSLDGFSRAFEGTGCGSTLFRSGNSGFVAV